MAKKETITPDWISEEDACKWLGINKVTLWRWRLQKGLHFTHINGKTVMYDRNQLNELLFNNSTYAVSNYQLKKAS